MKIRIICVGKIKDAAINQLIKDYAGRISHDSRLEIIEIKDSDPEEEGKKIIDHLDKIKDSMYVFALSEEGKQPSSVELSEKIKQRSLESKTVVFIIGGPFGLIEDVKRKADSVLSLSSMTFTHEMCRLFLLEQIYRSISIIKGRSYHK